MLQVTEGLSLDEIVSNALTLCDQLGDNHSFAPYRDQIADLHSRLAQGKLQLAVLGQFNRGKSTFLNALLGLPVLPTSVLPITSIPTVITHGREYRCTIAFSNGKPDAVIEGPLDRIGDMLLQHVAEENNPRNTMGVVRAEVECPSRILEHGTVLIDTPGFGSTHTHNTRTTLDLLSSCDAALFLLSADLPITQVEVDFLREAKVHVPHLFFIFNKTDLLKGDELATTQDFVRSVLVRDLGVSPDLRLFPISAKLAEKSLDEADQESDDAWVRSGLETVKTEIVDFMLRQKYFALAEALNKKGSVALDSIMKILDAEKADLETQLADAESRAVGLSNRKITLAEQERKSRESLRRKRNNLVERLHVAMKESKPEIEQTLYSLTRSMVATRAVRPGQYASFSGPMTSLAVQSVAKLCHQISTLLNKKVRAFVDAHRQFLEHCGSDLCKTRISPAESYEISPAASWQPEGTLVVDGQQIRPSFLAGGGKKRAQIAEGLDMQVDEFLGELLKQMADHIRSLLHESFARLESDSDAHYHSVKELLGKQTIAAAADMESLKNEAAPRLEELHGLVGSFQEVRAQLA